ncbi:MAG TPA: hypothetical protein VH482_05370 [Thermomicrobiales bacterium]|jgi:hypothetical protein
MPDSTIDHATAHDVRNVLAATIGRVQLSRRRIDRGDVDCARLLDELEDVEAQLRRALVLLTEAAAGAPVVIAAATDALPSP